MRLHTVLLSVAAVLSLTSTGCIKKVLLDGQIESTRAGAAAIDTVGDYDLGKTAAAAGLAQFEGMHALGPDNTDALFMLTKTWTIYGSAFIEDNMQAAQDAGNQEAADYEMRRAKQAYDRGVFFGLQLLGQKADGFLEAKKSATTLDKWLKDNFSAKEDAENLVWVGAAWLARVALMQGDDELGPQYVADLYVGASFLERAVAIDPSVEHYQGPLLLAAYHARSNMAELDQAKQLFDEVLQQTKGKALFVQVNYAIRYACMKGDAALYQRMLEDVLKTQHDADPDQRAANAVARRLAKRWLGKRRAKDQCGIDLSGGTPASTSEAPPPPAAVPPPAPPPAAAPAPEPPPAEAKPAETKPEKPEKPAGKKKGAKPANPNK